MNVAGFYGRPRQREGLGLPSGPPDMPAQWEKMSETLTVLQTTQQSNMVLIRTVMQRVDTLAKDFDEFKKQVTTKLTPPSAAAGQDRQSSGQRIPSELSTSIRYIYAGLTEDQQFRVDERYRSSHNQAVATWLMDQLKKTTKLEKHSEFYSRAVYRYYESRRRQFNDSLQSREEAVHANHKNSRKRRSQKKLYQDRQSVLKEKEQKKWGEIDPSFMTDESDYEQAVLNRMIAKLDQRLAANEKKSDYVGFKRRERVAGLLSVSEPPSTAPAWAVGDGSEHDHDKSMGLDVQTDGISLAEHSARSLDKDVSCYSQHYSTARQLLPYSKARVQDVCQDPVMATTSNASPTIQPRSWPTNAQTSDSDSEDELCGQLGLQSLRGSADNCAAGRSTTTPKLPKQKSITLTDVQPDSEEDSESSSDG
eukprot:Em0005g918a